MAKAKRPHDDLTFHIEGEIPGVPGGMVHVSVGPDQTVKAVLITADDVTSDVLRRVHVARILAFIAATEDRGRPLLERPDGSDPDAFYALVATAYRSAAAETSKPAVLLAQENDVPVESVRRWIKEARRRGHLAPARKGRAG